MARFTHSPFCFAFRKKNLHGTLSDSVRTPKSTLSLLAAHTSDNRVHPLVVLYRRALGENVKILGCSVDEGPNTEECFHNLEPLNRYAVVQLNICDFGDRESAVVEEFLAGSTGRVSELPYKYNFFSAARQIVGRSRTPAGEPHRVSIADEGVSRAM